MQAIRNEELELLRKKFDKKEKYKPNLGIRPEYYNRNFQNLKNFISMEGLLIRYQYDREKILTGCAREKIFRMFSTIMKNGDLKIEEIIASSETQIDYIKNCCFRRYAKNFQIDMNLTRGEDSGFPFLRIVREGSRCCRCFFSCCCENKINIFVEEGKFGGNNTQPNGGRQSRNNPSGLVHEDSDDEEIGLPQQTSDPPGYVSLFNSAEEVDIFFQKALKRKKDLKMGQLGYLIHKTNQSNILEGYITRPSPREDGINRKSNSSPELVFTIKSMKSVSSIMMSKPNKKFSFKCVFQKPKGSDLHIKPMKISLDHVGISATFPDNLLENERALVASALLYLSYRFFKRIKVHYAIILKSV